jgi:hypothetical protein
MNEDHEVRLLKRQVAELQRDLESLARQLPPGPRADNTTGAVVVDHMVKCKKCGSLLGFYDSELDVLRVKYKDHMLYSRAGGVQIDKVAGALMSAAEVHGIELDEDVFESMVTRVCQSADYGFVQLICRGCGESNTLDYGVADDAAG